MAHSQVDFSYQRGIAYDGMPADGSINEFDNYTLESGEAGFGDFMIQGSADNLCVPFADKAEEGFFAGLMPRIFRNGGAQINVNEQPKFTNPATLGLARYGKFWVTPNGVISNTGQLKLNAAGQVDEAGTFTLEGAYIRTTNKAAGERIKVELTGGRLISAVV